MEAEEKSDGSGGGGADAGIRERVLLRILKVADMLTRIGDMSVFGAKLTQPQFNILMVLRRLDRNGVSQKEILGHLVSTKGNVSIHIANLVRKGFVRKKTSKTDARANVITLTAKGRRVLDMLTGDQFPRIC